MHSAEQTNYFLQNSKRNFNDIQDIELLRNILRFNEFKYYVENNPLISDAEYDRLYKELEALERAHPECITADSPTQRVGADLNDDFVTVNHLSPMLSLENSYNLGDITAWQTRLTDLIRDLPISYSVEPKYDGAGISLIYENDLLARGATRGDGAQGDDITNNIKQIRSIPLSAAFSKYGIRRIEIRGEILLSKTNFKKYNDAMLKEGLAPLANPRNAAAGSMRMKNPADVRKRGLEAVLYHISHIEYIEGQEPSFDTHTGAINMLADLGFKTPGRDERVFSNASDVTNYCLEYQEKRDTLPYEIDGMVIKVDNLQQQQEAGSTSHHPRWAMAFKFKARQATSQLLNVEFQVGRTGSITPVAKINPVNIGGATVSSVSLFNEGIIKEKDLKIGDTVVVERAGDVIPYIVAPLSELRDGTEREIIFPTHCPICHDLLVKPEGEAVWRCMNINCPAQVVERMIHFVSKDAMDIQSLGESNVRKFHLLNIISDIPSIYKIDFQKIEQLERFGQKSINNLRNAIEASKSQPLHRLIFGLGIRYVGQQTAKELARNVGNIIDLKDFSIERLSSLKDIGPRVSESIFSFFHDDHNLQMLEELRQSGLNMSGEIEITSNSLLAGKTFLFTGTLPTLKRSEAQKMVEDNGGRLLSAVSANLDVLVVGESAGSKLKKAQQIGTIKIVSEQEFLDMLNG